LDKIKLWEWKIFVSSTDVVVLFLGAKG